MGEAKLAEKMQVLRVLGGRKLSRERSDLVKAVALLEHEKIIDATKLRAEMQQEAVISSDAMREARKAATIARSSTILSKELKMSGKKNQTGLRLKKLRSSERKLRQQLLTVRSTEAAENLRVKKVLQENSEALKVIRKSMENLQKKLDKLHEKLKVRSRMLRDEIVKKDNEKKKVLMTLKRAKETRTKTTNLATKEKRLHRQLVTLKRETTAVTSRLKQEKMHFSDAMRRLKREREKETAARRRTLGVLKRRQKQRKIFRHIRRQLEEKLKEEEEKEDVEERRLRKEKPTLVIAKGERSHFREKVEGLMLHYLGFLGTLKKEKKRLEVQMKKLSDQKRQGRNQMAILTRALRKELQKVKHELKMKRSDKLKGELMQRGGKWQQQRSSWRS